MDKPTIITDLETKLDIAVTSASDEVWFARVCHSQIEEACEYFKAEGFENHQTTASQFALFEKEELMLIACWDQLTYNKMRLAVEMCKAEKKPLTQREKLDVFRAIFRLV